MDPGDLTKGYKLYFKFSKYENTDDDTPEEIARQLDTMLAEVQKLEQKVAEGWN